MNFTCNKFNPQHFFTHLGGMETPGGTLKQSPVSIKAPALKLIIFCIETQIFKLWNALKKCSVAMFYCQKVYSFTFT